MVSFTWLGQSFGFWFLVLVNLRWAITIDSGLMAELTAEAQTIKKQSASVHGLAW